MKEQEFLQELKEINLFQQALAILGWDTRKQGCLKKQAMIEEK
jgi:Zn-dependent M32 family carboxypeptidase